MAIPPTTSSAYSVTLKVAVSDDYKFGEGLLTVRGEVVLGGNVVADKGFLIVNLTTAIREG